MNSKRHGQYNPGNVFKNLPRSQITFEFSYQIIVYRMEWNSKCNKFINYEINKTSIAKKPNEFNEF